jgi:hypothetical protein
MPVDSEADARISNKRTRMTTSPGVGDQPSDLAERARQARNSSARPGAPQRSAVPHGRRPTAPNNARSVTGLGVVEHAAGKPRRFFEGDRQAVELIGQRDQPAPRTDWQRRRARRHPLPCGPPGDASPQLLRGAGRRATQLWAGFRARPTRTTCQRPTRYSRAMMPLMTNHTPITAAPITATPRPLRAIQALNRSTRSFVLSGANT